MTANEAHVRAVADFDPFPTTNRATRRHCKHLWKTIGDRTACVECGETLTRDEEETP